MWYYPEPEYVFYYKERSGHKICCPSWSRYFFLTTWAPDNLFFNKWKPDNCFWKFAKPPPPPWVSNGPPLIQITSVRDGQPSRPTASVYVSGLRLAITVGCAGLLRTMPNYFRSTSNYAGLLPVYSGQLGRTQGFSAPAPRTSLGLGETTY